MAEQLSLFEEDDNQKKNEVILPNLKKSLSLKTLYQETVDRYLSDGIQSVLQIAEKLIEEKGAPKDRFLSGKPMIFVQICQYLDSLSHVKLVEAKLDKTDRKYELK